MIVFCHCKSLWTSWRYPAFWTNPTVAWKFIRESDDRNSWDIALPRRRRTFWVLSRVFWWINGSWWSYFMFCLWKQPLKPQISGISVSQFSDEARSKSPRWAETMQIISVYEKYSRTGDWSELRHSLGGVASKILNARLSLSSNSRIDATFPLL
jgi:hypothetical protein